MFHCEKTHLIVEAGLLDHADENVVSLAGNLYTLLGNVAENANGDTRAGEGVAVHESLVETELAANCLEDLA